MSVLDIRTPVLPWKLLDLSAVLFSWTAWRSIFFMKSVLDRFIFFELFISWAEGRRVLSEILVPCPCLNPKYSIFHIRFQTGPAFLKTPQNISGPRSTFPVDFLSIDTGFMGIETNPMYFSIL